jgi:hypothetical protein
VFGSQTPLRFLLQPASACRLPPQRVSILNPAPNPDFASRTLPIFSASSGAWLLRSIVLPSPASRRLFQIHNSSASIPASNAAVSRPHSTHVASPSFDSSFDPDSTSKRRWVSWLVFIDSGKAGLAAYFLGLRGSVLAQQWAGSCTGSTYALLQGPWVIGTLLLLHREGFTSFCVYFQ